MNRYLPAAWIVWAGLSSLIDAIALSPMMRGKPGIQIIAHGPTILVPALVILSYAIIYAIFNRVVKRRMIFWLGWTHLALQTIVSIAGGIAKFRRSSALAASEKIDVASWLWLSVISNAAGFLSVLCFFAIVYAAFNDTRRRIELRTFD